MRVGKNSEGTTESHSQSCNLNLILNCDGLTTWTEREGARIRVTKTERNRIRDGNRAKTCVQGDKGRSQINTKTKNSKSWLKHNKEKMRGWQKKGAKLIKTLW